MSRPHPTVSRRLRLGAAALAAAALIVPAAAGCSSSTQTPASNSAANSAGPVAANSAGGAASIENGAHLSPADFDAALAAPGTVVLDVRTPAEFAAGHLPNAKNMDIEGADFAQQLATLDPNGTYAVYCRSDRRSGLALDQMTSAGFAQAFDLAGGIVAWEQNGGQVVTG